ncbi:MAG: hypothetical protein M3Z25_06835 [Actinomycetota bacterium]|nr:hypothetical protein [Actinomycetota bacterium]
MVPLINKAKATPDIAAALNSVSAKLTTDGLVQLNRALAAPDSAGRRWYHRGRLGELPGEPGAG